MRVHRLVAFVALFWLAACSGLRLQDSYELVTLTPPPTATPAPVAVTAKAEVTGVQFFRAWENEDYIGMYDLIAARTQALVDSETFINRYRDAQQAARVTAVKAQPLAVLQEGDSAEMKVRVIWQTAVVGDIVREHTVPLRYENNRWVIDWNEGLILPELAGGNRLQLIIETPSRATIYDRNDVELAFQGESIRVVGVLPQRLQDEEGFLRAMSQLLGEEPDAIRARYINNPPDWYTPLGTVLVSAIQDNYDLLNPYFGAGLQVEEQNGRMYVPRGTAPHLIGYTGPIAAEQWPDYWARGYQVDARVGVAGLEALAEPYLAGTPGGRLMLLSPAGDATTIVQQTEAVPARNVHTTFDAAYQQAVEAILADALSSHPDAVAGAIVVLDVNTGAVRAMATYPTYDPSLFAEIRSDSGNQLATVLNDPARPLLNRAAQGEYPPGSTFKIVTTSAGLYNGYFQTDTRFFCSGVWDGLGANNLKYDWLPQGHGSITLGQALTRSCNPYMYEIGLTLNGADTALLPEMARSYGLGARTGLGISEGAGVIPDPAWKINALGEGWVPGDAVNMAIGQGFVLATPLQIAAMTAAVANGGTLYQPTLIDRVDAVRGVPETMIQPTVRGQLPLSAEQLAFVQQSLDDVTSGPFGTAVGAMNGLGVPTAGKTGTAEAANPDALPHAWFTGYAPVRPFTTPAGRQIDRPEIAVAVLIENAGEGSAVAAPIFRQVVEQYYGVALTPLPWE